jgi:hypothetical protein
MVVNATSAPHWSRRSPLVIVLGTEPPLVSVFVFGRRVVARVHAHDVHRGLTADAACPVVGWDILTIPETVLGMSFRSRMLFIKVCR